MIFQAADAASLTVFIVFSMVMLALILYVFWKANVAWKLYISFAVYLILISALTIVGLFKDYFIPLVPLFLLSMPLISFLLVRSKIGLRLSQNYSYAALIGFQAFRLPLELILHHWANTGVIPETMSWQGQNFDIITGLLALIVFPIANRSRIAAWGFQIIGMGLLLNVLRVVIFSSPFPFSWNLSNPLQLAMYFPYVLIAPLFVMPAILGHMTLLKKLLNDTKEE